MPAPSAEIGERLRPRRLRRLWAAFALSVADLAIDVIVFAATLLVVGLVIVGIFVPLAALFSYQAYIYFLGALALFVFGTVVFAISLLALPWALRGFGWIERERTNLAFGLEVVGPARRRAKQHGLKGLLEQWWLDASDTAPWRALAHLVIGSIRTFVFGLIVAFGVGLGVAWIFAPIARWQIGVNYTLALPTWSLPLIGVAMLAVGIGAALLNGRLDRMLSRAILGVGEKEAMRLRVAQLSVQRTGAVEAAAEQRRRIERDLHDEVQPRLVSIAMTLGLAKGKLDADPAAIGPLLEEAHAATKDAITELRRLVQGFQPAILADRGLDAALSAVAARCPVPTVLDVDLPELGCSPEAEAVVYFAVSEALTNVAKHARAKRCAVQVQRADGRLIATITDDGVGGARIGARSEGMLPSGGLTGMQDRAIAAGGSVRIASPTGGPTTVTVEVPCGS